MFPQQANLSSKNRLKENEANCWEDINQRKEETGDILSVVIYAEGRETYEWEMRVTGT